MDETKSPISTQSQAEDEDSYPPRKVIIPAMVGISLAIFLIAIDRTILGTAIPSITNEFNSFEDIAWYEAGFLLPLCMFQLSFGRIYRYYPAKWVLMTLVTIFEIGSIVCATAPSSAALIVGRVVTGIGGAGISSGVLILINFLVPLRSRPKWSGLIGAMFGIASVVGPLLGGYLTAVTWRWCFWINLPVGGVALAVLGFLCPNGAPPGKPAETWKGKVWQLDPIGFLLVAPAAVCLLFALQWGGVKYPWSDGRIIALLVLSGVLAIGFIIVQIWLQDQGTVPPKIFKQRSILAGSVAAMGIGSALVVYALYLPIWFQAIRGKSPQSSGLSLLPLLLSNVLFVILSGIITSAVGYYTPLVIIGGAFAIIGAGLITTWEVDASSGQWIGFQVILGIGIGMSLQQPGIAAQTVLSKDEATIGITVITFMNLLAGTIFTTVSQTLLANKLASGLEGKVQNVDTHALASGGATSLIEQVPADQLQIVLEVYNDSLRSIWYLGLGLTCLILVGALGFEWKSVKDGERKNKDDTA